VSSPGPYRWLRHVGWDGVRKEISLRERCFGGPLRKAPLEMPSGGTFTRSRRVVLMVHGFGVNLCRAGDEFENFTSELPFRWQGRTVWFYWPGDATSSRAGSEQPGLLDKAITRATYHLQHGKTEPSATAVVDLIANAAPVRKFPIRLTVIAHSLGCLITLHLLNQLRGLQKNGQVKLELVVLMAAAVPQYACRPGEIHDLAQFPDTKFVVYYSKHDGVLQYAFGPGQLTVSTGSKTRFSGRGAIGRSGLAAGAHTHVEQIQKQNGHSEYWSDREIAIDLAERLDGNTRPTARRFLVPRLLGSGRDVQGRPLKGRSVQSASGVRRACTCP
jgi:esterase/lipase superfamily enzyme